MSEVHVVAHPAGAVPWPVADVASARRVLASWEALVGLPHEPVDDTAAGVDAAVRRLLDTAAAGAAGVDVGTGHVTQVSVSDGGVPKRAVARAAVTLTGVAGDRQADREHHGRPFQAVCLWSQDVIDAFAAEGHPVAAGAAGENLTVAGLDWPALRPGVRLRAGTAVLEVSVPAVPCRKNARWFTDEDVSRIEHTRNPGASRWYAWVVSEGEVAAGDAVVTVPR